MSEEKPQEESPPGTRRLLNLTEAQRAAEARKPGAILIGTRRLMRSPKREE